MQLLIFNSFSNCNGFHKQEDSSLPGLCSIEPVCTIQTPKCAAPKELSAQAECNAHLVHFLPLTPHASLGHRNIAMDETTSPIISCIEQDCKSTFKSEKSLRNHVNNYHQVKYTISFQGDKGTTALHNE